MMMFDPVKKDSDSNKNNSGSSPSKPDTHVVYVNEQSSVLPQLVTDLVLDKNRFLLRVFDIMFIGLCITAATCFALTHWHFGSSSGDAHVAADATDHHTVPGTALQWLVHHPNVVLFVLIAELVMVHAISGAALTGMSSTTSMTLFVTYAIMNGVTLAPMVSLYTDSSVVSAFTSAAVLFFSMSCFGYATKRDLSTPGAMAASALWGIIAAMFLNVFLFRSSWVDTAISVIVVIVFMGLTAWDIQRIKQLGEQLGRAGDHEGYTGQAVVGALILYLDFLNTFLHLLKLFGERK